MSALLTADSFADPREIELPAGDRITVLVERPTGTATNGFPLCVLLPGGPGTENLAKSALSGLGQQLVKRGWVVAAPVSPNGKPFYGGNGRMIPGIVRALQADPAIGGGKALLAGLSNGGIAAFEVAGRDPTPFLGVVALPGVVRQQTDLKGLKGVRVFLRIGAKDELGWARAYHATRDRLVRAGAILDSKLVPKAGHGVPVDWAELDRWLSGAR
jgi:dienelactone hydrolase